MPFHAFTHSFIDTTIGLSYINNSTSTYSKHKQFFTCCSCCPQYSLWLSDFLSLQIQFFLLPSKTCVLSGSSWSFSPLCWPPILPGPPWVPLRRLMWPAKTQKTEPPLTRIISISSRCPQFHILYTIHHHSWFSFNPDLDCCFGFRWFRMNSGYSLTWPAGGMYGGIWSLGVKASK